MISSPPSCTTRQFPCHGKQKFAVFGLHTVEGPAQFYQVPACLPRSAPAFEKIAVTTPIGGIGIAASS